MRLLLEKIEDTEKQKTITIIMKDAYHAVTMAKAIKVFCQIADRGGDCSLMMKMSGMPFLISTIGHDVRNCEVSVGDEEIGNQDVSEITD